MKISPNYENQEYSLLDFTNEDDWQKAINMLEDRISGRFFRPVELMRDYQYSGFAIMALDCLLIETLQQFRNGVPETPYGENRDYFVNFLIETSFNEHFNRKLAHKFYYHVRNGILHQAETKNRTKIRNNSSLPLVSKNGTDLIINRNKFHDKLIDVFYNYIDSLRNESNSKLRNNFKNKMDHICRV